jgi:hypothetical protein
MNEEARWQDEYNEDPELNNSPVLAKFKTSAAAMKGLVDLEAYRGNSARIPGESAEERTTYIEKMKEHIPGLSIKPDGTDPEDTKRYWNELGVPKDIDGYVPPADFEVLDDAMMAQLKDISHKAGLTTEQYHNVLQQYGEATTDMAEQAALAKTEADDKLKQHWGSTYDENIEISDKLARQFEDKNVPLGELTNSHRLMLMNLAKSMTSEPQVFEQINKPPVGKTPAEVRMDIEKWRKQLTDRTITGPKRKLIMAKFKAGYDELAQYKQQ